MKLRGRTQNNAKNALLKRIGTVAGIVVLVVVGIQLISYATRPHIQYTLQEANCSSKAIEARNKALGADLKACVVIISAKNLANKFIYVDYDGIGGGPFGEGKPLIRIYSTNGKFCYALVGEGGSFSPNATNMLTLRCGVVQKAPKGYNESSDANPISIVIAGYSKTTIKVEPVR